MKNLFSFFRIFLAKINITSCAPACLPTSCVVPVLLKKLMTHSMNTNYLPFLNLIATYENIWAKNYKFKCARFFWDKISNLTSMQQKIFFASCLYVYTFVTLYAYIFSFHLSTYMSSFPLFIFMFVLSISVCLSIYFLHLWLNLSFSAGYMTV